MIPFRDRNPSGTVPVVTVALIMANIAVFAYAWSLGPQGFERVIREHGLVPSQVLATGRLPALPVLPDFLTSMFLHAGLLHLLGNIWYLWIFGDNVEDRLGHGRFLIFYLLCGLCAGALHVALNARSGIPTIGASGAVAGVLGAYLVSFPRATVLTFVPYFFFWGVIIELPAVVLLGLWFIFQFLSGVSAVGSLKVQGGVAWWAHIGGFLAGIILLMIIPKRRGFRLGRT